MKKIMVFLITIIFLLFCPIMVNASTTEKIHFIKDASFGGDAIVIESNGHFGLIDTMNPGPSSDFANIYSNWNDAVDNGTKVYNYVYGLMSNSSRKKLDFIIITHNHSDHIGGLSEIKDLIDDKTVVFYKEDIMPNNDFEDTMSGKPYHNHDYYLAAMQILNNKNAVKVDVSKPISSTTCSDCFVNNIVKSTSSTPSYNTNLKDYISFEFGDFDINLYNLYTLSNHMENLNSIVTLVTNKDNGIKTVLMGDQEAARGDIDYGAAWLDNGQPKANRIENPTGCTCVDCPCTTLGIENQIADVIGQVDILKAGHHGHGATYRLNTTGTSNSYYMLNKFRPKYYFITYVHSTDGDNIYPQNNAAAGVLYMHNKYGTDTYYTSQSEGAAVVEFTTNNYVIKNFNSVGSETNTTMNPMGAYSADGWCYMYNEKAHHYEDGLTKDLKAVYVKNNSMIINKWHMTDGKWYYFGSDGIMQEGLVKIDGYYYYLTTADEETSNNPIGSMVKQGWKSNDGHWYYFRTAENDITTGPEGAALTGFGTIDSELYYFRRSNNDISNGPEATMINGLATIDGDTYYFRKTNNEISNGPEGSALKNTCTMIDNTNYCFGDDGILTSSTTYISAPTDSMCNILTYNGSEQTLTKTAGEGYTWSNNKKTNAGSYTVSAVLENGYKWSDDTTENKNITCSIGIRKLTKPTMTTTEYTYSGSSISPTVNDYDSNTMNITGTSSSIDAGNFSVTISIKDTNNDEWSDSTNSSIVINWKINKVNQNAPTVTSYTGTYDGLSHSINVSGDGTIEYSLDQEIWSEEKPSRIDVGITTVYVRAKEDTNHNVSNIVNGTIEITEPYIIDNYSVDENYINRISPVTDVETFESNFNLGTGYSIIADYKTIGDKNLLYTGGKTKIMQGSVLFKEYTNIVSGDTNGDGKLNYLDYVNVYNHIQKVKHPESNKNLLEGVYLIAGDMSNDNKINYLDYVGIYNKIKELKANTN